MSAIAPTSIDAAIDWLRRNFRADSSRGLSAVFQFRLSGERGGSFFIRVDGDSLEIRPGESESTHVVLRLPAEDYFAILGGGENADLLYMEGRLEIEGDLSLAMKLRTLFRAPS